MSRKTANEFKEEAEAEVFSAMAAEGHISEGKMVSNIARRFRADPVLVPIIKNKQGPKGRTSLMYSAKTGDVGRVNFLLRKGADATKEDADLHSVVYYAALGGNPEVLRLLLENGADLNHKNKWGNTALHYAAAYGNVGAVRILCQAGANVNEINQNENTALMQVLEPSMVRVRSKPSNETKAECVRILLEAGSDVNMRNKQGSTALSLASSSGNVEAVRALCAAGSDVNTRDNDGSTPLLMLISNIPYNNTPGENVEEIVEILLSNGANPGIPDERGRTLEMFIDGTIEDEDLKGRLKGRIASVPSGGAQGGGARRGKKTRARAKAKAKAKAKTRKARS